MRPLAMSTLLLALPAITALPAGVSRANNSVTLELRSAAEIGPQILPAKGPGGERAIEVINGPDYTSTTLVVGENLDISSEQVVIRGQMKSEGAIREGYFAVVATPNVVMLETGAFSGASDWHDFVVKVQPMYPTGNVEPSAERLRHLELSVVLKGQGKVTIAEPLVVLPRMRSDDGKWHTKEPGVALELRSAGDVSPRVAPAVGPAGEPAIEVAGGAAKSTTTLVVCDNPAISSLDYVLRGRVKYAGVVGDGYLELLNDFGDEGTHYSRTLLGSGPMQKLTGTSDWRDFELPFYAEGMKPRRLTLNVVLPGAGSVTVAEPLVVAPLIVNRGWWTERQAGLIGGGLGTLGGALGSLIGIAAALRKFALARALCGVGLAAGAVSLIAGLVAVCAGQPWHVWYPLLLIGFISMSVCGPLLVLGSRLFQADELRRMTGLDAM